MAVLPLNTFKTIARPLTTTEVDYYTCPVGVTGIVLLAQIANVGTATAGVSFSHMRLNNQTYLVKDAQVPKQDALSVLTGRLVLQEGERIRVQASNNDLQMVLSIVESANT